MYGDNDKTLDNKHQTIALSLLFISPSAIPSLERQMHGNDQSINLTSANNKAIDLRSANSC